MLTTAALHLHMDSAAHGLGPSSTSPAALPASAPSPTPATAAPPNHHHRPAARRVSKRRPRPSRKLPTTYISADPASFRRMVQQVTGADDLPAIISPPAANPADTLCRPAPSRAMLLPTLDTSAFLLGGAPTVEAASAAGLPDQQAEAGGVGAGGGACNYNGGSSSCGGGFPTLDSSWDPLF